MNDKQAAKILLALSKKDILTDPEKEAIKMAVGILTWTELSIGRVKQIKDKQKRDATWR